MASLHRLILSLTAAILYGAVALTPLSAADVPQTGSTAYKAGETAGDMWQSGKEAARKAWEATKETARGVWSTGKETAREGWSAGKETAKGAWDTTKEKTGEVTRDVKEGWKDGTK